MAYCFMHIGKIKSDSKADAAYRHIHRIDNVPNADPALKDQNEDLIKLPEKNGRQMSYSEIFKERMEQLPYYKNHKIRCNQNRYMDVVLTFSREEREKIDIETWKQKQVEWLKKTFNVAPDGRDNVIDAVLHADEPGNIHIHALVIPIDERGHLNSARFVDGPATLSKMQDDYAQEMECFGLERGLKGSTIKHETLKKFYSDLNKGIEDIPAVEEGESAEHYFKRYQDHLEALILAEKKKAKDRVTKMQRKMDQRKIKADKEIREIRQQKIEAEEKCEALKKRMSEMTSSMEKLQADISKYSDVSKKVKFYDDLHKGIDILEKENPIDAEGIREDIEYALETAAGDAPEKEKAEQEVEI